MSEETAFSRINFQMVSRSVRNGSVVKVSAYHSGTRLQHKKKRYDFRHKTERQSGCILLPDGAPDSLRDPGTLWRTVEDSERRHDSQLARQILINLPRELAPQHRLDALRAVAEPWRQAGMAIQIDYHCPRASDGNEQPHGHLLLTLREVTSLGLSKSKNREWNREFRADDGKKMRAEVDRRLNQFFSSRGLDIRVDNRSREARGLPRNLPSEPQARPRDWAQWLREGARPERAPIMIKAVLAHRENRAAYEKAISVAEAAEVEIRQLEIEIAEAEKVASPGISEPPPSRNNHKPTFEPARAKVAWVEPNEEETMSKKPSPQGRPDDRRAPKTEAWQRGSGGFEALSDENQRLAKAAHLRWCKTWKGPGSPHPLESYVAYVQDHNKDETPAISEDDTETTRSNKVNAVSPSSQSDADDRRREILAALLAERYRTPEPLLPLVSHVEIDKDGKRAVLHTQHGRVIDHGNEIQHEGELTPELAGAIVSAAASHGWSSISSSGSTSYREAIGKAAALHQPPVLTDYPLPKDTLEEVTAVITKRNVNKVGQFISPQSDDPTAIAKARLEHASRLVDAKLASRPKGSIDADEISSPRIASLIERRQQAMDDARHAIETASAHRAEFGLVARLFDSHARHRQSALDSEAARMDRDARRLDRGHEKSIRRIEKEAGRLARDNERAMDDWEWSKPVRAALAEKRTIEQAKAGIALEDEATISALVAGDLPAAAREAMAAQAMADPRGSALKRLAAAEKAAEHDPAALAQARWATAAAIAGDENTITAANAGDPNAVAQAAADFQRRQREEEMRQRGREVALVRDTQQTQTQGYGL